MPNTITVGETHDPFTGKPTGHTLLTIQLTPHYRRVLDRLLEDPIKKEGAENYGVAQTLWFLASGTPSIGGCVMSLDEAIRVMEWCDDNTIEDYTYAENNLLKWLFEAIHDLNLQ